MKVFGKFLVQLWTEWFQPRSSDPTVAYRERALRIFLPVIVILRAIAIVRAYSDNSELPTPFFPIVLTSAVTFIPLIACAIFLIRRKVDLAGISFLAQWYLTDLINLPAQGYWYPGFLISVIMQGVLAAFLLPGRLVFPFLVFQLATLYGWISWFDTYYFDPPLLSSGQPIASFRATFLTLVAQETIFLSIVRYLRSELEKYLRQQLATIQKIKEESVERQQAEARLRSIVDNSPATIMEVNRDGIITFTNNNPELIVGKAATSFLEPADREWVDQAIAQVFETRQGRTLEVKVHVPGAGYRWNSINMGPVYNDGNITSIEIIASNIHDQKEEALRSAQRARHLATLAEISHTISTLVDLDTVFETIYHQIQRIVPADALFICIYNEAENTLTFPATYDLGVRYSQADAKLTPGTPLEHVLKTGGTFVIHRTPEEIAALENQPGDVGNPKLRSKSLLYVPLWQSGKIVGAMSIQSYSYNAYPDDLVETLAGVGDQVATAILNSQLFTSIRQELAERKRAEAEIQELNIELEQRVRARTIELEAANRELESFSYSVSHDLRAPLRAIVSFSSIIKEEYESQLDETGRGYLQKVINSGKRMSALIDDLLSLSRIGHKSMNRQEIDLANLVRSVIENLALETNGRQIEWVLTETETVIADPMLLQQVYANLIGNAVKYTARRPKARIEIGCNEQNNEKIHYVRDNGAGFNMKYASKLFGVFQRLHSEDEFEGTGIGLATVQRIIQRHGGRIWAEAEPDKGASFFFTLGGDMDFNKN